MKGSKVKVYSAAFESEEAATEYSEQQWEPEPDESVSDEEYSAWEERNPSWKLADELGFYMDSDFIETIHGEDCWKYLESVIGSSAVEKIPDPVKQSHNTLILVYEQSIDGVKGPPSKDLSVTDLGEHVCV